MKWLLIVTLWLCSCYPHKLVFRTSPKEKFKPASPNVYRVIAVRYDAVRYTDTGEGKERQFRLTNDSLIWLPCSLHLFAGDTIQ